MNRRFLMILTLLLVALTLAACDTNGDNTNVVATEPAEDVDVEAQPTEEPTEEPATAEPMAAAEPVEEAPTPSVTVEDQELADVRSPSPR